MLKEPISNIFNPKKNFFRHSQRGVPNKSYVDPAYSLDLICEEALTNPHLVLVEYNSRGTIISTLIEIQFDVNVGYVNQSDPLPSGSIVRLEFIPVSEYRGGYCDLPHVLLRTVVENHFTLNDGRPGSFHDFRQSTDDRVNHTGFFYTPQKQQSRRLVEHRTDLSTYTQCPIPTCYCRNIAPTQQGVFGGPPSNPGNPGSSTHGGFGGPPFQGQNPGQSTQPGLPPPT